MTHGTTTTRFEHGGSGARGRLALVCICAAAVGVLTGVAALSASAKAQRTVSITMRDGPGGNNNKTLYFRPNTVHGAVDGDKLRICNKGTLFAGLFSPSKENRFGMGKGLRLRPGDCTTLTVHNTGSGELKVTIGDEVHNTSQLHVYVAPRGSTPGKLTTANRTGTPVPDGAFPGGTATTLTLNVEGKKLTRNLKTGVTTPAATPTVEAVSGTTIGGAVTLNGTLPKGWVIYVWHPTTAKEYTLLQDATGGLFTGIKVDPGFSAYTGVGAYICPATRPPPSCNPPAGQANINIHWTPPA